MLMWVAKRAQAPMVIASGPAPVGGRSESVSWVMALTVCHDPSPMHCMVTSSECQGACKINHARES